MAKRRPGPPSRRQRVQRPAGGRGEPEEFLTEVAERVASGDPLEFLGYVSTLLAGLDQRRHPLEPEPKQVQVTLPRLLNSFAEADLPETTALLAAFAELAPDELNRARARRALASRSDPLPNWLARLGETSVYRAVQSSHVLGDGDNVMLGVTLPGYELSMVIYIDHNLGTVVKDAFPVPEPIDELLADYRAIADDPDTSYDDLSLADARARADAAIELGTIMFPPFETDTWPGSRPLARWLLRTMPEGGTGYVHPEWNDAARKRLMKQFLGSDHGAAFTDDDQDFLLEQIVWFGTVYGTCDPLQVSPVVVELLLADRIPRKIVADPACLAKVPDLLRAYIRFCHAERGIRPSLTEETLAAVDAWEPEYQQIIGSPRPQGTNALLAAMGVPWEPESGGKSLLDRLAADVGGHDVLGTLDDTPLPDEEFRWDGVPDQLRDRVEAVLAACDRCSDELLGAEYKTACRRLLARAVPGMAKPLAGRGTPEGIAVGVLWVIGSGNERFGRYPGQLHIKDMATFLGVNQSAAAQRGAEVMRAAGIRQDRTYGWCHLGTPDLVVSARRRRIIELRDTHRDAP
jgi:hypothetical protein